jgi:hypothetical protein
LSPGANTTTGVHHVLAHLSTMCPVHTAGLVGGELLAAWWFRQR